MDTQLTECENHLLVICRGEWLPAEMVDVFQQMKERAAQMPCTRFVMDCSDLAPPREEFYRFEVGQAIADILPIPFRMFVLLPEALITKFTEDTARNRGADVLVCSDEAEGMAWLHGG